MKTVPISLKEANAFVEKYDELPPVHRDKFRIGCISDDGHLCGVIQAGRPLSRHLDDGTTLQIVRWCTDKTPKTEKFLFVRMLRIAKIMGYKRVVMYTQLEESSEYNLKSLGWEQDMIVKGHTWDCPSRPRANKAPICDKQRWCYIMERS